MKINEDFFDELNSTYQKLICDFEELRRQLSSGDMANNGKQSILVKIATCCDIYFGLISSVDVIKG